ncbi:MAG: hypothetical protein ACRDIC_06000 [bacterium]
MTFDNTWRELCSGMPKNIKYPYPSFCGQCHEPLDVRLVLQKIKLGKRYVHPCGRILVRGDAILELTNGPAV